MSSSTVFRIADTFTHSLGRLTADEQKAIKTTAFDLQVNPAHPGHSLHKLDKAKDKHFWSVRVSSDIRIIVHKSDSSFLLCYVDHHDKAYQWAERRKLEVHPVTGAAQIVEIRERIEEIVIPTYVERSTSPQSQPKNATAKAPVPRLLFGHLKPEFFLAYGVPTEWLADVQQANEDSVLEVCKHLPSEAAEAVLALAVGEEPIIKRAEPTRDPFEHPDAERRFRILRNRDELEQALAYPWDKWMLFLHPDQRQWVEKVFTGPARIAGSAGTGKTIVALHRAVALARKHEDVRILLTTFSETLAKVLQTRLMRLISSEPKLGERIDVYALNAIGKRIYERTHGPAQMAMPDGIDTLLLAAASQVEGQKFSLNFLRNEWLHIVDAWQLKTWDDYRDVKRLGRKTRLSEAQRQKLWAIFEKVLSVLNEKKWLTYSTLFAQLTDDLEAHLKNGGHPPYDYVVVDEAQDISIRQLRYLSVLGQTNANALFFAGDLGQRIFQQPFSWKSQGIDIRGRSVTLMVNYRMSHQIRSSADKLLSREVTDVDGLSERRRGTVSVFNGPPPQIKKCASTDDEISYVGDWLRARSDEGYKPHEIGVFVRSRGEIERAKAAVGFTGLKYRVLDEHLDTVFGYVSIGTMHLAKGLEFRGVAVMACDDEIIPSQERIAMVTDESDLEDVYETERHLLYVACTRARDSLLITSGGDASEFIDDMIREPGGTV